MSEPAWISPTGSPEALEREKQIYADVTSVLGKKFDLDRVGSLWPAFTDVQEQEFTVLALSETELGPEIKDLIAAYVSQLNNCKYSSDWYKAVLNRRGWSDEKVTHVLQDIESEHLDPLSRAIMVFADKLTKHPQAVNAGDVMELRQAGLDERGVIEVAAVTGYFNYMTRLATVLDSM